MSQMTTRTGTNRLHLDEHELLDFQYMRTLSYQLYHGASTGEVLHVAAELKRRGNTRDHWTTFWTEQGQRSRLLGEEALAQGHVATARVFFLRAYNYLRAAEYYFDRTRCGVRAHRDLYQQSVASFDASMRLLGAPVEKITIPFLDGIAMPGYFFKVTDGAEKQPTVIICGGGDSFGEETYFTAGVPEALARGLNVLVFHGPGQRGLLHDYPDQVFRPDYEVPIGKVIEYALSRPDVDADRLGLYGYSLGGYLAPRAAACDPRIRALAANAPMLNFHDWMLGGIRSQLPAALRSLTEHTLGILTNLVKHKHWVLEATIELYFLWTNGVTTIDDYLAFLQRFTLTGLEERFTCPVLCLSAEGEGEEPVSQAQRFYEALHCPKTFISLATNLGAENHCGLDNIAYTSGVVFDWFCEVFGHNSHFAEQKAQGS
jgi:alpha-beta hydrolase superfamily lysophospholipase